MRPLLYTSPHLPNVKTHTVVIYLSPEGSFGLGRSYTEVRRLTFCLCSGFEQTRKSHRKSHRKFVLFGGCSSRRLGGLLSKTAVSEAILGSRAVHTCCCSYCCMAGDLAQADQTQVSKIYCHKRDINLSQRKVCSVYHALRKCTRGDGAVYLHRAGPGTMGHRGV